MARTIIATKSASHRLEYAECTTVVAQQTGVADFSDFCIQFDSDALVFVVGIEKPVGTTAEISYSPTLNTETFSPTVTYNGMTIAGAVTSAVNNDPTVLPAGGAIRFTTSLGVAGDKNIFVVARALATSWR